MIYFLSIYANGHTSSDRGIAVQKMVPTNVEGRPRSNPADMLGLAPPGDHWGNDGTRHFHSMESRAGYQCATAAHIVLGLGP